MEFQGKKYVEVGQMAFAGILFKLWSEANAQSKNAALILSVDTQRGE